MTSPAYRACVARLERLLSPRVASRTLLMGMREQGITAATASAADLDPVMKGPVFKQLQVAIPAAKARDAVAEIVAAMDASERETAGQRDARVEEPHAGPAAAAATSAVAAPPVAHDAEAGDAALAQVQDLRERMRPYNLYFEWPEVRRLRAQLQRLDDEARAGGGIGGLLLEAEELLVVVTAKREDMLVLQAKDLAELEEVLEEVQPLGGSKVRRLESLVKHVREAQDTRQLVDAEIVRSRKLARDLRKLMASSVFQDEAQDAERPDTLRMRLEALDREAERQDLERTARSHALLLEHDDDLAARFAEARELAAEKRPLGERLTRLQEDLPRAETERRQQVEDELAAAAARFETLPEDAAADLARELEVLRSVLETGLPPVADLLRFRDLLDLADDRAERAVRHVDEGARREDEAYAARRAHGIERLHQYERGAERLAGIGEPEEAALQEALAQARAAIATGAPVGALDEVGASIEQLTATLEHRTRDVAPRLDAALATFRTVERLNSDEVAATRRILVHLDTQREAFDRISPGMHARLEASLQEAEGLLATLVEEERATRAIADQLMAGSLDDMFGLFGDGREPARQDGSADPVDPTDPAAPSGPVDPGDPADPAEAWVRRQGERRGVAAAVLLTRGKAIPLATHRVEGPAFERLPAASDRMLATLDDLGSALGLGAARLVTLEGPQGGLVVGAEPDRGRTVALLAARDVATVGLLTHDLRDGTWAKAGSRPNGDAPSPWRGEPG